MSGTQLRRYEIKPGEMDDFLAAWRGAVPVRRQHGFEVVFACADRQANEFTWIVRHDGDFDAAQKAYYASPERAALPVDPAVHLDAAHVAMVEPQTVD